MVRRKGAQTWLNAVPDWCPAYSDEYDADAEAAARTDAEGAWLAFSNFDMDRVVRHGAPPLASSGGQEFELGDVGRERPRDRLLRQRAILQEQLGHVLRLGLRLWVNRWRCSLMRFFERLSSFPFKASSLGGRTKRSLWCIFSFGAPKC